MSWVSSLGFRGSGKVTPGGHHGAGLWRPEGCPAVGSLDVCHSGPPSQILHFQKEKTDRNPGFYVKSPNYKLFAMKS